MGHLTTVTLRRPDYQLIAISTVICSRYVSVTGHW